jgi:hypothetical protein
MRWLRESKVMAVGDARVLLLPYGALMDHLAPKTVVVTSPVK